jgi:peptidoglycan/LPS O-acetylase OafA/YrhL
VETPSHAVSVTKGQMQNRGNGGAGQLIEVLDEVPFAGVHRKRRFYQPELDGLRFYAFLGVFVCHALPIEETSYRGLHVPLPWLWGLIIQSGSAGVDLFFALSAFLITSLLLRERQETGGISLRLFYTRRILRIWPLYFLVVVLGIVIAHAMPRQSHFWYYTQSLPWYYIVGYALFMSNWVYAVFGAPQSICAPLWTVSIEEQFYLIWPVVAKMLSRRGMMIAAIVTFLFAVASQIGIVLSGVRGNFTYFGSASRCDSLALGIVLALGVERLPKLTRGLRLLLVAGGLIGLLGSSWLMNQPYSAIIRVVPGRLMISLGSAAILYGCMYSSNKLLTSGWIVQLGKISYGLYALHFTGIFIILSLLRPAHGLNLLLGKALGLAMTVFLASVSYRWFESPFLRLKSRFATVPSRPI